MTTAQRGRRGAYRGRRVAPRNRPASSKGQTTRAQRRRTIQLAVAGAIFVLLAMGMMMLPPMMVSMPFKLLLFVMVDGWNLLVGSLVNSFLL